MVIEKFRFCLSTRKRLNSVFKKFHSGKRFRKVAFLMIVFRQIYVDGALVMRVDDFSVMLSCYK